MDHKEACLLSNSLGGDNVTMSHPTVSERPAELEVENKGKTTTVSRDSAPPKQAHSRNLGEVTAL